MQFSLIFTLLIFLNATLFSQNVARGNFQKPNLDTSVFYSWPSLYRFGISDNGMFVYFLTRASGNFYDQNLNIKSLNGEWQHNIVGIKGPVKFSSDSKTIFFLNTGDSLNIISLGQTGIKFIPHINSFNVFKNDSLHFLIYKCNSLDKELVVKELTTNNEVHIKNVNDYVIDGEGNTIITKSDSLVNGRHEYALFWSKLAQFNSNFIFKGNIIGKPVLSKIGKQMAFIYDEGGYKSICYSDVEGKLIQLLNDTSINIPGGLHIQRIDKFSEDGSKLFIYLKQKPATKANHEIANLTVWSYTDGVVQSIQQKDLTQPEYLAVINIKQRSIIRLQNENDIIASVGENNDGFIYVLEQEGDGFGIEQHWNVAARGKAFVVSTFDGTRIKLEGCFTNLANGSPGEKFLVGSDGRDMYSYQLSTKRVINLTKTIPVNLPKEILQRDIANKPSEKYNRGLSFAAWKGVDRILVYDEFDIWEIDLKGKIVPFSITNGFGRKNTIRFRLTNLDNGKLLSAGSELIVSAFDKKCKSNGFYKIVLGKEVDPQLLSMGNNWFISITGSHDILKSNKSQIYLVRKESATQSPNLYWTRDFRTFYLISSIFPEKEYNWLTSELSSFKTLDGRIEQGVLYKPENFDKNKKYPVVIHYYENKSNELNKFPKPGNSDGGQLDIAWFVSQGYIVFTPDIHYRIGATGRSAYNSIVGAAKYLKTLPYINPNKIGIQGHSFGGYETNYLVANSKVFAAAISSSGPANFVTAYLSENPGQQFLCEVDQNRLGKSLWEDIPMYIENSPVFKAYNVTTPILTVANRRDNNVPFIQGTQWFMALRRLGKRAWMLEYNEGGHGVDGKDYVDYVIRSTQFFDHYLKESACPRWMLYGIPAKDKGVIDGLDLIKEKDPKTGKWLTPKEGGLLTEEEKKKVKALQNRKPTTIKLD